MKKHMTTILVIAGLLVTGTAFAAGSAEQDAQALTERWETVTVTGTVSFADLPHPEITSGRTTWELRVPRYALDAVDVAAGDTVTVEGIPVDTPSTEDERVLMVVSATIDGEEFVVDHGFGDGAGPGFGPMGRGGMAPGGTGGGRIGRGAPGSGPSGPNGGGGRW